MAKHAAKPSNGSPKLIVIRHAHREAQNRLDDTPLSGMGREQALELKDVLLKQYGLANLGADLPLYSSPKQRCQQTLEPLSKELQIAVQVTALLDEQGMQESQHEFLQRVKKFLTLLQKKSHPIAIICSHGDWIPVFGNLCSGEEIQLEKGSWAELSLE